MPSAKEVALIGVYGQRMPDLLFQLDRSRVDVEHSVIDEALVFQSLIRFSVRRFSVALIRPFGQHRQGISVNVKWISNDTSCSILIHRAFLIWEKL